MMKIVVTVKWQSDNKVQYAFQKLIFAVKLKKYANKKKKQIQREFTQAKVCVKHSYINL